MAFSTKSNYPAFTPGFADFSPTAGIVKAPFQNALGTFADRVKKDLSFWNSDSKATYVQAEAGQPYAVKSLGETVIHHVMLEGANSWYFDIAPVMIVEQDIDKVVWNETTFDRSIAQPTPELGTVRLVTASRKARSVSFRRQGIGYYMEAGFSQTEAGQMYHIMHLMQLQNGILEVMYADTVMTCIGSHGEQMKLSRDSHLFDGWTVNDVFDEARYMFASLNKTKLALNWLHDKVKVKMQAWGGNGDTWIVPPKFESYLAFKAREYTRYSDIGPNGPRYLSDNKVSFSLVGGNRVFFSRSYQTGPVQGTDNLLARDTEIGEYVPLLDRHQNTNFDYMSQHRAVRVYNEDEDDWFDITLDYCLDNCELFDENGEIRPVEYGHYATGPQKGGFTENDLRLDLFRYVVRDPASGADLGSEDVQLFGQMEPGYFTTSDKILLAESVRKQLGVRWEETDRAIKAGVEMARQMDSLDVNTYGNRLIDRFVFTAEDSKRPQAGLNPKFATKVARIDPATGFLPEAADQDPVNELIPGLQSYYGFRYIALRGDPAWSGTQIAKDFVLAIQSVVAVINKVFGRTIYTDPRFGSSWWQAPSAEGTWFERVLFPSRVPLFAAAAVGGEEAAKNIGSSSSSAFQNKIYSLNNALPVSLQIANIDQAIAEANTEARRLRLFASLTLATASTKNVDEKSLAGHIGGILSAIGAPNNTLQADWGASVSSVKTNMLGAVNSIRKMGLLKNTQTEAASKQMVADLHEWYNQYLTGSVGAPMASESASYVVTPLLCSPAFAGSTIAAFKAAINEDSLRYEAADSALKAGRCNSDLPKLWPANPTFTEVVCPLSTLDEHTAHVPHAQSGRFVEAGPYFNINSNAWSFEESGFMQTVNDQQVGLVLASSGKHVQGSLIGARTAQAQALANAIELPPQARADRRAEINEAFNRAITLIDGMLGQNFEESFNHIQEEETDLLLKAFALTYDGTIVNKNALKRMVQHNVRCPLGFLICRPHQVYNTLMAIFLLAGSQTLINFFKPGKFMVNTDAATQAHFGTLTATTKTGMINHRNCCVTKDVMMNGYKGGNGVTPFTDPDSYQGGAGKFAGQSVFVIAVPYNHTRTGPMSLSGYFSPERFAQWGVMPSNEIHYTTAARYCQLWGWHSMSKALIAAGGYALDPDIGTKLHNIDMLPGFHIRWSPSKNGFKDVVRGNGWTEGFVYPGCKKVHNGEDRFKEKRVPKGSS